jgi:hypothetical protein
MSVISRGELQQASDAGDPESGGRRAVSRTMGQARQPCRASGPVETLSIASCMMSSGLFCTLADDSYFKPLENRTLAPSKTPRLQATYSTLPGF